MIFEYLNERVIFWQKIGEYRLQFGIPDARQEEQGQRTGGSQNQPVVFQRESRKPEPEAIQLSLPASLLPACSEILSGQQAHADRGGKGMPPKPA
ncbi:hypothetical protein [Parvibaculum sp.]|uniref:hypothetical protein n=1 Tax=Parvibaculum sp. TaxID=2024848 RepID=UPI0027313BB1|nr:hypothetical protein [Parvibaculum sp.]MDP1627585.1 hypothetical protein [Parvibaculum sp.]MDP2148764.1 hypothetical protein [Parvibaculum sp.]MDP3328712.1 hypothetical protein [Parvibaculum sp.]